MGVWNTVLVALTAACLAGCIHSHGQWSVADYDNWMQSDPAEEVRARTGRGIYSFLAVADHQNHIYWIPGIADKTNKPPRHDDEYHGSGIVESTDGGAEKYMREFNVLMEVARMGVTLDVYGHSSKHPNFNGPRRTD